MTAKSKKNNPDDSMLTKSEQYGERPEAEGRRAMDYVDSIHSGADPLSYWAS